MTLRLRFALTALLCAAGPATAAPEDLPPSVTFPVLSADDPTWVYAVHDPPVTCAGLCPRWTLFQGPLDEITAWQTRREACRSRSFEEPWRGETKWFLREPMPARVPDGILHQSVWHLRVRRFLGSPREESSRFLDVLEWKAVFPVRMRICRMPDANHVSPTGKGAVDVQERGTSGMRWVVITGPDPSFVMDVAWLSPARTEGAPLEITWNAAGDEATVIVGDREKLRVSWRTRSTTLIAPTGAEDEAMREVADLSLRDPSWSARADSAPWP